MFMSEKTHALVKAIKAQCEAFTEATPSYENLNKLQAKASVINLVSHADELKSFCAREIYTGDVNRKKPYEGPYVLFVAGCTPSFYDCSLVFDDKEKACEELHRLKDRLLKEASCAEDDYEDYEDSFDINADTAVAIGFVKPLPQTLKEKMILELQIASFCWRLMSAFPDNDEANQFLISQIEYLNSLVYANIPNTMGFVDPHLRENSYISREALFYEAEPEAEPEFYVPRCSMKETIRIDDVNQICRIAPAARNGETRWNHLVGVLKNDYGSFNLLFRIDEDDEGEAMKLVEIAKIPETGELPVTEETWAAIEAALSKYCEELFYDEEEVDEQC